LTDPGTPSASAPAAPGTAREGASHAEAGKAPPPAPSAPPRKPTDGFGARALGVVANDWPLKILAIVLAVTTWSLVRERLKRVETFEDVRVEVVDVPRDVLVRGTSPDRVSIVVEGTRSEIEAARTALQRDRRVTVRFPTVDRTEIEGTTPRVGDVRAFGFPFEGEDRVRVVRPAPEISWVRVEEKTVVVARPEVVPARDPSLEPAGGYPTLDTSSVVVRGPARVVRSLASLVPDPVDANPWLDTKPDLAAPWSTEVGFSTWRADDPLRSRSVLSIEPSTARVTLKYRQTGVRTLSHALDLQIPADALTSMAGWEVVVSAREYDAVTQRITLPVRSDKRTLDEMEQDAAIWSFSVRVPSPPAPGEDAPTDLRVPVLLTFSPPAGASRPVKPPATLDGAPTVFVSLRRR
jgi:hypothetical protein